MDNKWLVNAERNFANSKEPKPQPALVNAATPTYIDAGLLKRTLSELDVLRVMAKNDLSDADIAAIKEGGQQANEGKVVECGFTQFVEGDGK
jgi:hypothetical protein